MSLAQGLSSAGLGAAASVTAGTVTATSAFKGVCVAQVAGDTAYQFLNGASATPLRAAIGIAGAEEEGNTNGCDFAVWSYDNNGGVIAQVLRTERATGDLYVNTGAVDCQGVRVNGAPISGVLDVSGGDIAGVTLRATTGTAPLALSTAAAGDIDITAGEDGDVNLVTSGTGAVRANGSAILSAFSAPTYSQAAVLNTVTNDAQVVLPGFTPTRAGLHLIMYEADLVANSTGAIAVTMADADRLEFFLKPAGVEQTQSAIAGAMTQAAPGAGTLTIYLTRWCTDALTTQQYVPTCRVVNSGTLTYDLAASQIRCRIIALC